MLPNTPEQQNSRLKVRSDPPLNVFLFILTALLYTPVEVIYLTRSPGYFTLNSLVTPVVCCIAALVLPYVLWLRWPNALRRFDTLFLAPTLYILITTTFFPVHGGVLDGRELTVGKVDRSFHVGLLVLCVLVALLSLSRNTVRRTSRRLANVLGLFAVGSSVYMALSALPSHHPIQDITKYTGLSATNNVIVLVLDMLQGSFGAEYFKRNPASEAGFDGFVFHRNTASFAPYTALSYASFMPGGYPMRQDVTSGIDYRENIIDDLTEMGFRTRYFGAIPYANKNKKIIQIREDIGLSRRNDFILFAVTCRRRYMPYNLVAIPWAQLEFKRDAQESLEWYLKNVWVDRSIDKGFVWFHSLVTHRPVRFNANGRFSEQRKPDEVHGEVAYALGLVQDFVERLKTLGVYDNSLVIVMSEHGYNILHEMTTLPDGSDYFLTPFGSDNTYVGQYEPLLMVKKPGAHGTLQYDHTAITLLDLRKSLKEFAAPGSGAGLQGFNFLGNEKGSSSRVVPVVRFVGADFDGSKDFTSLDNWQRDTLRLPLAANYGSSSRSSQKVNRGPGPALGRSDEFSTH